MAATTALSPNAAGVVFEVEQSWGRPHFFSPPRKASLQVIVRERRSPYPFYVSGLWMITAELDGSRDFERVRWDWDKTGPTLGFGVSGEFPLDPIEARLAKVCALNPLEAALVGASLRDFFLAVDRQVAQPYFEAFQHYALTNRVARAAHRQLHMLISSAEF